MMNNQTYEHLEKLAEKRADFEAFPRRARICVGLERLENYSSNLVVAWIENSPREVLHSLLKTELYMLVRDTTAFVSQAIDKETEPQFQSAWQKFESFILKLESGGSDHPDSCYVGIFFSAIILRNFFELLSKGKIDPNQVVQINEGRYSPAFIGPVMLRFKELLISFNIHGKLLQKVDELPAFLDQLSQLVTQAKNISG
jgi:hypothetical protein